MNKSAQLTVPNVPEPNVMIGATPRTGVVAPKNPVLTKKCITSGRCTNRSIGHCITV